MKDVAKTSAKVMTKGILTATLARQLDLKRFDTLVCFFEIFDALH